MAANRTMKRRIESPMIEIEACLTKMGETGGAGEGEEVGGVSVTSFARS